jgi:plastocyanin
VKAAAALVPLLLLVSATGRAASQAAELAGSIRLPDTQAAAAVIVLLPADGEQADFRVSDTVLVDQFELRFLPAVLAVRPGTTVLFRNSDPVQHNVFSPAGPGSGFNLGTYPRPGSRAQVFESPGVHVILCHVHPEMAAYVNVVLAQYATVADSQGRFRLSGVAPGRYLAQVWVNRRLRLVQPLELLQGDRRVVELTPTRRGEPQ